MHTFSPRLELSIKQALRPLTWGRFLPKNSDAVPQGTVILQYAMSLNERRLPCHYALNARMDLTSNWTK